MKYEAFSTARVNDHCEVTGTPEHSEPLRRAEREHDDEDADEQCGVESGR
jgi:hypothetical protein